MHTTKKFCWYSIRALILATLVSCSSTPEQESSPVEIKPAPQPRVPINMSTQQLSKPAPEAPLEIRAVDAPYKAPAQTDEALNAPAQTDEAPNALIKLCEELGSKLGSVSIDDCLQQQLIHSNLSVEGRSLAYRDFPPLAGKSPLGRVLVIGGIHGDEYSSVSILFKWMQILDVQHAGLFHWRFIPTMNPDGLLRKKSQRQNHNGVDLNRNFPTADWEEYAVAHWRSKTHSNPRRYPGPAPASEPETQWLVDQIAAFKPDVIISMHAPYHLVDYDGPLTAPNKLGGLYLRDLGVFPGSMGNYAGLDLDLPIVTVELKSAGIMPSRQEVDTIWSDLVRWLRGQLSTQISESESSDHVSESNFGQ